MPTAGTATELLLSEHELKAALHSCNLTVPPSVVVGSGVGLPEALPFPYPVAAKVSSRQLLHKTEAGAVRLNVPDRARLVAILEDFGARFPGSPVLIEPMERPGVEAIVGFFADPVFGMCAMLGVGGIFAELYQDVAFRRLPLTIDDVDDMLDELKGRALFEGFRNIRADRQALARLVVGASRWVESCGLAVAQMDLNPVFVRERDAIIIDAKVMGRR